MEEHVELQVRWLASEGVKVHHMAYVMHLDEVEIHQTLDSEMTALSSLEDEYLEFELPKLRATLKEWETEFPTEWKLQVRREYLCDEINRVRTLFFDACKRLAKDTEDVTYWLERHIEALDKRLKKLGMEVKIVTGKPIGITPETIAKARNYPIDHFIKVTRGMAKCPFHPDKSPSLDVRKNFYHCYGCGVQGDVIDFVMKTRNMGFRDAIALLS